MKFTTSDPDGNFVVNGNQDIASDNNVFIQRVQITCRAFIRVIKSS